MRLLAHISFRVEKLISKGILHNNSEILETRPNQRQCGSIKMGLQPILQERHKNPPEHLSRPNSLGVVK